MAFACPILTDPPGFSIEPFEEIGRSEAAGQRRFLFWADEYDLPRSLSHRLLHLEAGVRRRGGTGFSVSIHGTNQLKDWTIRIFRKAGFSFTGYNDYRHHFTKELK